jgi:hypothetical protein
MEQQEYNSSQAEQVIGHLSQELHEFSRTVILRQSETDFNSLWYFGAV